MSFGDVYRRRRIRDCRVGQRQTWHRPRHLRGRDRKVRTMLIATTLLFTIVSTVLIGIVAGYASIWGILAMFGRRPSKQEPPLVAVEGALANH